MNLEFEMTIVDPRGTMWSRILAAMEGRGLTLVAPAVGAICRLGDEQDAAAAGQDDTSPLVGSFLPTTHQWLQHAYTSGRSVTVVFWTNDGWTPLSIQWSRFHGRSGPVYTLDGRIGSIDELERYRLAAFFLELLGQYQVSDGRGYQCEFRVIKD